MWVGLVLAALAALGSSYQQHQVAQKQDNMLYQALRSQEDSEAKAKDALSKSLNAYSPDNAKAATDASKADYLSQVQKAIGASPVGGANSTTTQAQLLQQQRSNDSAQKTDALANLYGTIGGTMDQRQNEGIATQRTGNTLNLIGDQANRTYAADVNRARSIQSNPWLSALWQVMGAAGSAYGASAGSPGAYGYGSGTPMSGGSTASMGGGYTANLPFGGM
jgi:hypothetical protein